MWLEAIITEEDLTEMLRELLPVKIHLNHQEDAEDEKPPERWLLLQPAKAVALVPDRGLRVTCPAELMWTIAGISPTVKIDELSVLLRLQVVEKHKGQVLEVQLEVEEAEFHRLPQFIDATIVRAVNVALAAKKIPWNFTETLTRSVGLGKVLEPIETLKIAVMWGKTRISAEALGLVVSLKLGFVRGD